MKIQLELTAHEVRTAIHDHIVATRPDIVKDQVIKVVLNFNAKTGGETETAAVVVLEPQPPSNSGYRD